MTSNDEDIEEIVLVNNKSNTTGPIKKNPPLFFDILNDADDVDGDADDVDGDTDDVDGGDEESEIEDGSMEELMNSFFTNDEGDNIADIMTGILKGLEKQNAILMKIGAVISKKN